MADLGPRQSGEVLVRVGVGCALRVLQAGVAKPHDPGLESDLVSDLCWVKGQGAYRLRGQGSGTRVRTQGHNVGT